MKALVASPEPFEFWDDYTKGSNSWKVTNQARAGRQRRDQDRWQAIHAVQTQGLAADRQ
jgi:hypothetical protein